MCTLILIEKKGIIVNSSVYSRSRFTPSLIICFVNAGNIIASESIALHKFQFLIIFNREEEIKGCAFTGYAGRSYITIVVLNNFLANG